MTEPELQAAVRTETGKANVRRLRRTGYVPCILYGVEKESQSLAINRKELEKMLSEAYSIINVKIDGNEQRSVVKEIQYHPLKGEIIHLDLQRVKAGQEIHISVPIKFVGSAPGVKAGGVFQTVRTELDVSTLPKYLPGEIEIDISNLEIGDSLHISDLQLENITINHDSDSSLCSVLIPKKVEEPVEAEEEEEEFDEESAEPEVISSKEKEEGEEDSNSEER